MLGELSRMWAQATGQSEAEILVVLTEVDPANAMEAGAIRAVPYLRTTGRPTYQPRPIFSSMAFALPYVRRRKCPQTV